MRPFPALRRLLAKTLPAAATASLVATGLVAPAQTAERSAPVSDKVQTLVEDRVTKGWQRSVDTGQDSELVGFEWDGVTEGGVEVRARKDGRWGEWTPIEGDPFEGPDPSSRVYGGTTTAGPLWVGNDVRQVEVRVTEGELRGLKLHALDSEEPASSSAPLVSATPPQASKIAATTRGVHRPPRAGVPFALSRRAIAA